MESAFVPKISVVTACYNHGKYIGEMIESVLCQTFQDFEIIIVNDGSTDNTRQILDEIKHEKIVIRHTEHLGPSHARNTAIKNARAQIIFNLDADDKIAFDLLEKGYNVFSGENNAGIVFSNCRYFGAKTGNMRNGVYSLKGMLSGNKIVSAAFFRMNDWEKTGGYSERFIYGLEDWDLWLSIIELGREVIKIPDSLVYYRTYNKMSGSRSGRRKSDRKMSEFSNALIFERHRELYSQFPDLFKKYSKNTTKTISESFLVRLSGNFIFLIKQKVSFLIR